MKGDYYRYLGEFFFSEKRKEVIQNAQDSYKEANLEAENLKSTHPIRLSLVLNWSVFYYEILSSPDIACKLAKQAFDNAIADLDGLIKQPTRVLSEINDEALEPLRARREFRQGIVQVIVGVALEVSNADIAQPIIEGPLIDRANLDLFPGDIKALKRHEALALYPDGDGAPWRSAQTIDRVIERHIDGGLLSDLDDLITALQTRS